MYTLTRIMHAHYGKPVILLIDEYDVLHASESNLWSVLYLTGYLTRVNPENIKGEGLSETGKTCLRIPNEEIKTIFADTIAVWFGDTVKNMDRKSLFDAFWNGEEQRAAAAGL